MDYAKHSKRALSNEVMHLPTQQAKPTESKHKESLSTLDHAQSRTQPRHVHSPNKFCSLKLLEQVLRLRLRLGIRRRLACPKFVDQLVDVHLREAPEQLVVDATILVHENARVARLEIQTVFLEIPTAHLPAAPLSAAEHSAHLAHHAFHLPTEAVLAAVVPTAAAAATAAGAGRCTTSVSTRGGSIAAALVASVLGFAGEEKGIVVDVEVELRVGVAGGKRIEAVLVKLQTPAALASFALAAATPATTTTTTTTSAFAALVLSGDEFSKVTVVEVQAASALASSPAFAAAATAATATTTAATAAAAFAATFSTVFLSGNQLRKVVVVEVQTASALASSPASTTAATAATAATATSASSTSTSPSTSTPATIAAVFTAFFLTGDELSEIVVIEFQTAAALAPLAFAAATAATATTTATTAAVAAAAAFTALVLPGEDDGIAPVVRVELAVALGVLLLGIARLEERVAPVVRGRLRIALVFLMVALLGLGLGIAGREGVAVAAGRADGRARHEAEVALVVELELGLGFAGFEGTVVESEFRLGVALPDVALKRGEGGIRDHGLGDDQRAGHEGSGRELVPHDG